MKQSIRYYLIYWLPVFTFCFLIFIQSSVSVPDIEKPFAHFDKFVHIAIYAFLAVLFFRAYVNTSGFHQKLVLCFILSAVSASTYGATDELHQAFVSVRTGDLMDWLADLFGAFTGALCCLYFYKEKVVRMIRSEK